MTNVDKIVGVLLVMIMISIIVFVKPNVPPINAHKYVIDSLEQQIIDRNKQLDKQKETVTNLINLNKQLAIQNDSLNSLKQQVKIKYEKIYVNISNANNNQLDSIIRTSW